MEVLLKVKHWQVFLTLLIVGSFKNVQLFFDSELPGVIAYVFSNLILIGWYVLIGVQLKKKIGSKLPFLFVLFLSSAVILISISSIPMILFSRDELLLMIENKLLFSSLLFFSFVAVFNLAIFPAKALRIIEIGEDIDINDYFGDIFRLLFLPIGIWNIQSRLNKIAGN